MKGLWPAELLDPASVPTIRDKRRLRAVNVILTVHSRGYASERFTYREDCVGRM